MTWNIINNATCFSSNLYAHISGSNSNSFFFKSVNKTKLKKYCNLFEIKISSKISSQYHYGNPVFDNKFSILTTLLSIFMCNSILFEQE